MTENIINKDNAVFERTEGGFVRLTYDGKSYSRIKVVRLFPFTDPDKFLSIRDMGDAEKEIGVIEDLNNMSTDTKVMLNEQLDLYYFTPIITKVISIKDEYGYAYFHVDTDHGECKFTINMGANAVTKLTSERLFITDVDGNRFEIPNVLKLTIKEQRKLDLFL